MRIMVKQATKRLPLWSVHADFEGAVQEFTLLIKVVVRVNRTWAYVKAQQKGRLDLAKQPINRSKIKWALKKPPMV
jgi:hypothetical protein